MTAGPGRVPGWLLAAATREVVEQHDRWDGPHHFIMFCWDGTALTRGADLIIPRLEPSGYLPFMARAAGEWINARPRDLPCAYLLQTEGHGVTEPGADAAPAARARYDADRRLRGFSRRPDAVETCTAWTADTEGRTWSASKIRGGGPGGADTKVTLTTYPAGDTTLGGRFLGGLRAVAAATAEYAAQRSGL